MGWLLVRWDKWRVRWYLREKTQGSVAVRCAMHTKRQQGLPANTLMVVAEVPRETEVRARWRRVQTFLYVRMRGRAREEKEREVNCQEVVGTGSGLVRTIRIRARMGNRQYGAAVSGLQRVRRHIRARVRPLGACKAPPALEVAVMSWGSWIYLGVSSASYTHARTQAT